MKNRIIGAMLFIPSGLVILTPMYILPVCEFAGRQRMACTYTGMAEMFVGAIVLSIAIGAFFSKSPETLRWLMFVSLASGLSVIFMPSVMGYCKSPAMPCNYGTVPMLRLLGILIIIISVAPFIIPRGSATPGSATHGGERAWKGL